MLNVKQGKPVRNTIRMLKECCLLRDSVGAAGYVCCLDSIIYSTVSLSTVFHLENKV